MEKETRELLAKLFTHQLKQLAEEKGIDCGENPDRIDYLSILGKSDLIDKEDVERFIGETKAEKKEEKEHEDERYLGEVEKTLKDFKTKGSIFDEANGLLQRMQSRFDKGDLEGTISQGVIGSGMIEDTAKSYEKVRRAFILYAFRQLISDVRNSDIDIGDTETLVSKAAQNFHNEENEELDAALEEIAKKAVELQKEQAKRMKELILSVEEFIDQARDLGANIDEAKELFRKAEEAFDAKTFNKVGYFVTKARKVAEDARKDRIQGISDSLLFVRSILDDAREIGADVTEAEKRYDSAKTAFREENYRECKTLIKETEQLALQLQDTQIQKAMRLRSRMEVEKEPTRDTGEEVVEVEPELAAPQRQRVMRPYVPTRPSPAPAYARPAQQRVRKAKCPNCGQRFPVKAGKGPVRVECPYCGMRGSMP